MTLLTTHAAELVGERLDQLLSEFEPRAAEPRVFLGRQFDLGLAWVSFPSGRGGLGAPASLQRMVDQRLTAARAPRALLRNAVGIGLVVPTLAAHGTDAQQDRHLRPMFTGEEIWCQLFSEPDAGSDLAALRTEAVRDGDEWVLAGQKVWTSLAHRARFGLLLARTDPNVPKHRGISAFIVDMQAPGVEVRLLRQMTGDAEFNEVFLSGVRVADSARVGDVGNGWNVGRTTLMNERVLLSGGGGGPTNVGGNRIERLLDAVRAGQLELGPVERDHLARLYIESQVIKQTNLRARAAREAGRPVGPEGSITKLMQGLHNRRLQGLAVDLLGTGASAWSTSDPAAAVVRGFLRAQANTIEGGTSDVLRNVLGERVLGLPREPDPDRDRSWNEALRAARTGA
ncbi:MAG: acyl-CoA dehydrogenase family protein [Acidimicrobiia bacterium]